MTAREASHAGSWYTDDAVELTESLDEWLGLVNTEIEGVGMIPKQGARAIIAPHAGYDWSGRNAAWAYKSLDLSQARRIFLLGPSHRLSFRSCALSRHSRYSTPMGDLPLDLDTIAELRRTDKFRDLTPSQDAAEHSLEMHLPYIYHMLSKSFSPGNFPLLIPIMVGDTRDSEEKYGKLLAPYLGDPSSVFVVSGDFCHWGYESFGYTYYLPTSSGPNGEGGVSLRKDAHPNNPKIHESIAKIDDLAMEAISTGIRQNFVTSLNITGNTVCGQRPIGVIMAAIEELNRESEAAGKGGLFADGKGLFKRIKYDRSKPKLEYASDTSVSYVSAFAVL